MHINYMCPKIVESAGLNPYNKIREEATWDQRMCNGWKVPGAIIMTCRKLGENVLYMAFQNEKKWPPENDANNAI